MASTKPGAVHIPDPIEPVLVLPTPPSGLASFFGKKKYAEALANAHWVHEQALIEWHGACRDVASRRQNAKDIRARDEEKRLVSLKAERERYAQECAELESEAADNNMKLDELITNLGYGTTDAIQEYVSIVLSNSVYPDQFQVVHEFEFDPSTAELRLHVLVPGPGDIPAIKSYKYTKAADEIASTTLSQKECRDRYTGAIHQVALRSFHEVFESDRRGLIKTISLEVGTNTIDPATGQQTYVPFVIAAAERETFLAFELSAVVPALTLARLGAAVSKNPHSLVAAERSGVRRS
jgi:restriction system protein